MGIIAKLLILAAGTFALYSVYRMFESWLSGRGREAIEDLDEEAAALQELAVAKARTLRDIKDLEFDYQTGHIAKDEYEALRKRLERKGVAVLRRLDELELHGRSARGLDPRRRRVPPGGKHGEETLREGVRRRGGALDPAHPRREATTAGRGGDHTELASDDGARSRGERADRGRRNRRSERREQSV